MTAIQRLGLSCQCCALLILNDDTSGCESNCGDGHVNRLAQYGTEPGSTIAIDPEPEHAGVFRCVGCGDEDYGYGGVTWEVR